MTVQHLRFQVAACLGVLYCGLAISPVLAATIIGNGGDNTINIPSIDVEVRDSIVPLPTTVNIVAGGQVGFSLNPDGTIEMVDDGMGGMVAVISNANHSVAVFDNSVLNMSDGETADSVATFDNATATISGGLIGDSVIASGNSTVMMTGGDVAGDLEVSDTAQATISGGAFAGNLSISGDGEVSLSVASFEEASVSGNGTLYMIPDAEIADVAAFQDSSRLEMTGGVLDDDVILLNSSTALINGGEVDTLIPADNAQAEIQSGEIGEIAAEGNTLTNIYDGTIGEVFATGLADEGGTDGTSRVNIFGGVFAGPVSAVSGSVAFAAVIDVSGGSFEEGIAARGIGAKIDLAGATLESFDARELEATNLGELNVNGATGTEVDAGASIGGEINLNQLSADTLNVSSFGGFANINGGEADVLNIMSDRGFVSWRGGQFGDANIEALSNSVVTIFGHDFLVNGMPFAGGDVMPPSGDISGLLADGSPFSALFSRQFEPANRIATIRLIAIPEPGMIAFATLALPGLLVRRRRIPNV